jgi:hypothetical protein
MLLEAAWLKWVKKLARLKGVMIKSKGGIFPFGYGLPDDEVRYLYSVVREALGL